MTDAAIKTRGVFYVVADVAPLFAILTSMFYLVVMLLNFMFQGLLNDYIPYVATLMIFGATMALPLAIFDIMFTGLTKKDVDIVMMGFTNYFALFIEHARTNWEDIKPIINYVQYVYLAMFIVSLIYVVTSYLVWRKEAARR